MKVNINLDDSLVKKVDERAKAMYVSRSAYICMALAEKMKQDDLVATLPKILASMESMKFDGTEKE